MRLCFATNNKNKIIEVQHKLGKAYDIISLSDLGQTEDLPETQNTLEGNSLQKARFVHDKFDVNCFADDTGLLVEALDGQPGVMSARYSGPECNSKSNVELLLRNLRGISNRRARFITVITLILNNEVHVFTGRVDGIITEEPHGSMGFGYDPVFIPEGLDRTFAELDLHQKNTISHRSIAVEQLVVFLNKLN